MCTELALMAPSAHRTVARWIGGGTLKELSIPAVAKRHETRQRESFA
jgi:hypothetical protein